MLLAGTTFVASAVEFVEAATIVLAVGYAQGWRISLSGMLTAGVALGAIVGLSARCWPPRQRCGTSNWSPVRS